MHTGQQVNKIAHRCLKCKQNKNLFPFFGFHINKQLRRNAVNLAADDTNTGQYNVQCHYLLSLSASAHSALYEPLP